MAKLSPKQEVTLRAFNTTGVSLRMDESHDGSTTKMKWLGARGFEMPSMNRATVYALFRRDLLHMGVKHERDGVVLRFRITSEGMRVVFDLSGQFHKREMKRYFDEAVDAEIQRRRDAGTLDRAE